jgi:hypothetical protein
MLIPNVIEILYIILKNLVKNMVKVMKNLGGKMDFKPTAGEIANLWKFIIGNQSHLCVLEHWLNHVEDEELKVLLLRSINEAEWINQQGLELYQRAGFPAPTGFNLDTDVVPNAPRLMSDKLILITLHILSEYGVYDYGLALGKTKTPEVLSFLKKCLNRSTDLYQSITEIVQKKGYEPQSVYIPTPKQAEFVNHHSFLAGWWGEQRPVNAIEIDNLMYSLRGVILAKTLLMVFSQIAKDPKVQKFCRRGKEIAGKRVERIQSFNTSENLPFQATFESELTDSTTSPFSDRLIMFESIALAQIAIVRYGNALSNVMRRDLSALFATYIIETGTYLNDGIKIMIDNKWFEQPPMASDRKKLVNNDR